MDGEFDTGTGLNAGLTNLELVADALESLSQSLKTLHPKWLYDARGSSLFEEITELEEYYLTRTETEILRRHSSDLAAHVPEGGALVELGAGASVKTRILLDACEGLAAYVPTDISARFLQETADALALDYPGLLIAPVAGDFLKPILLPDSVATLQKTLFFPGSTLGNLDPAVAKDLLKTARTLSYAGAFILGIDLLKEVETLKAAYDDTKGVTAEFISNILVRLNREAEADFDPTTLRYEVQWNETDAQIEMRLISIIAQEVSVGGHPIWFEKNEPILVSVSRKYTLDRLRELVIGAGWSIHRIFTDDAEQFAVVVLR
ncbi:L-histidine N(alpha)-methyltransferase [Cognatishimia maritima]|uniref:Dimethylhistidine N-methyltransferase n=1 Tax=Cognatishimia maritima TaxID=870908 RepID=A0A1M5VZD9_9RHOB|nr:L-histidine N(alpha)-methyltransferase [Cognatishimia maritima]SHH80689.1 dimethylhistidine N-methyltransferase [Cognatishimia maritima]